MIPTKVWKVLAWMAGVVVLAPVVLVLGWLYLVSEVYESKSPSGVGSAILYQESSPLDTVMSLSVRDYGRSGSQPIGLGKVSDMGGLPPEKVVWSKDGSVVAVRDNRKRVVAYDFRAHRKVWANGALLATRGGEGAAILSGTGDFRSKARHVWWWESYPTDETP